MEVNLMNTREPMLITSKTGSPLYSLVCNECDSKVIGSKDDCFCTICGSSLPEVKEDTLVNLQANAQEALKPILHCATCESVLVSNDQEDPSYLAATLYCPVCGSAEVDTVDEEEVVEVEDDFETDVEEDDSETDVEEDVDSCETTEASNNDDTEEDVDENDEEDVEEEVKDKLGDGVIDEMEATLVANPEPTWFMFSKGEPILRIKMSAQPKENHILFKDSKFFTLFKNRAKGTSLLSAAREFNADVVEMDEVLSPSDVEEVVYDNLQSSVMPKFLDCVNLAIEGMVRNIYTDLNAELKASFYDELKARGVVNPRAAVDATFGAAGSKVFAAIVAKAMELYNKPDNIRSELKSTILATDCASDSTTQEVSEDDLDSIEVKEKLVAGNLPIKDDGMVNLSSQAVKSAVVDNLRDRINLGQY
jgi:hypothetical protein